MSVSTPRPYIFSMGSMRILFRKLLLVATLNELVISSFPRKNKTVYILSLLPYPDAQFNPSWRDGPAISLALDMAQDQINNQTELLPDYRIQLLHDDSGCEFTTKAYVALIKRIHRNTNQIIGIIGPGCSDAALSLAQLTSHEKLRIVTLHGGANPLLSNRSIYQYALSSHGSSDLYVTVGIFLMQQLNWTQVGVLFDDSQQFYSSNVDKLKTLFLTSLSADLSINILPTIQNTHIPLEDIIREGLRINLLFTHVETTQQVLCLALHRGMVYDAYQWIVTSNFFDEVAQNVSFLYKEDVYSCSEWEMKLIALNGTLFFNHRLFAINKTAPSTYAKFSSNEYDRIFREKISEYNNKNSLLNRTSISYSVWSTYFFDSLWAWSVALDRLSRRNPGLDLTKYQYGDTLFSDMLMEEFYNLDFEGVSGRIKFLESTGFVLRALTVFQVKSGESQYVASYDVDKGFIKEPFLLSIADKFDDKLQIISQEVIWMFIIIILLQLILLIVLHILTLRYRSSATIRASSFKLHQILYFGCYSFGFSLLMLTLNEFGHFDDSMYEQICNLTWVWLIPISFSLTFGTVAVRTWRLYRIFTHYLNPGRFIGDRYLVTFVLLLVVGDIVTGTLWMIFDPQKVKYTTHSTLENVALFQTRVRQCENQNSRIFYGTLLGTKTVLVVMVFILTIITRNIKNQHFTTKTLRILVYLFCLTILGGSVTYFVSRSSNPLSPLAFIVITITFNIALLLFIALVLLPPLSPLLKKSYRTIILAVKALPPVSKFSY